MNYPRGPADATAPARLQLRTVQPRTDESQPLMTTATELPAPGPDARAPQAAAEAPITMLNPDFPFSYDHYLAHPDGLGSVPPSCTGPRWPSWAPGLSGLVTAYELMKLGLRPVVYEADQIGGRLRTASFPSAPGVVADLGGMRFPVSGKAFYHYVDLLGLETQEFPNPLAAATSSTVIELAGEKYYAETPADLPPFFREVADAWKAAVNDGAKFTEMQDAIRARDTARIKELWNELLPLLDEQTFYGFIAGSDSFKQAGFAHREAFGQVGFGTGGWDTDFPNSILEILRVVYTDADDQHRLIAGGAQRLPEALWQHAPSGMAHWPDGTSLASLHAGAPRGAVDRIARDGGRRLPGPGTVGPRVRLPRRRDHLPVVAAVHPDPHRREAVPGRALDGDRALALHAVVQDLRDGGPALLEGHRSRHRPRGPVHDADGPAEPGHVPAGQRPGPAGRDPAVLHLERRRAEMAGARRRRARGADAALARPDLPRRRHRRTHRGPAHHGLLGSGPQLHGRVQGEPAGALPLPAAALHPLQAGQAARSTSAGFSWPATTSPSRPAGPKVPSPPG